jgi:hypothetical protein
MTPVRICVHLTTCFRQLNCLTGAMSTRQVSLRISYKLLTATITFSACIPHVRRLPGHQHGTYLLLSSRCTKAPPEVRDIPRSTSHGYHSLI